MEEPSGLSIASVNVSKDPITRGSDQEVSMAVVDNNSADAPAAGVDVMLLTVFHECKRDGEYLYTNYR